VTEISDDRIADGERSDDKIADDERSDDKIADNERSDESSQHSEGDSAFSTVPPQEHPHNGDTGTEILPGNDTTAEKEQQTAENQKIADNLISKVKKAVEEVEKEKMKQPLDPLLIQNMMLMCHRFQLSEDDIDGVLEKLCNALTTHGKTLRSEKDTQIWWNWYSLSCVYLVRSHREEDGQRRKMVQLYRDKHLLEPPELISYVNFCHEFPPM
jgi:hypothetical protein